MIIWQTVQICNISKSSLPFAAISEVKKYTEEDLWKRPGTGFMTRGFPLT
jgi:hypothetical protein